MEVKIRALMGSNIAVGYQDHQDHAMKTYWESGGTAPRSFNLGTRWRCVFGFTPQPLYPRGKSPRYSLDSQFRKFCEVKQKRQKILSPCLLYRFIGRAEDHVLRLLRKRLGGG